MKRISLGLAASTLVLALVAAGCGGSKSSPSTTTSGGGSAKSPIVIGFATAESGAFAAYDQPAVQAAKMKIAEINANGGLDGHQLKVVSADTKTDIGQARVAADEVLSQGAQFVMTTCDFDYGAPSVLEAQKKDVATMSSCAGSTKFRPATFGPLAFSMAVATPAEGASMAEFAYNKLHKRSAYVLTDPSIDQTKQDAAAFTDTWGSLGGTILGQDTFQQDDQSISAQVTRIRGLSKPPDVIFVSSYPPGGARAIRQLRAGGVNSIILADSNFDGNYWLSSVPGLKDMYHDAYVSIFGDDPSPSVNTLVKQFTQKYGHAPDTSIGFITGYSVIEAFAKAYGNAKTTEGKALTKALEQFHNEKLTIGPTTFSAQSHITPSRPVPIIAVSNGKSHFVTLWTPTNVPNIQ